MKNLFVFDLRTLLLLGIAGCLATGPLLAQERGPTPIGRAGATWQHDIDRAEELQAQLLADLSRLSEDEWKEKALAWVRFETDGGPKPSRIDVVDSHRVGDLRAKKADITRLGEEDAPTWQVTYPKKPPKNLDLVLTDVNETAVTCKTGVAIDAENGHLGIFVHEGSLFCLARPKAA